MALKKNTVSRKIDKNDDLRERMKILKLNCRTCCIYVPLPNVNHMCVCGKPVTKHPIRKAGPEPWKMSTHTELKRSNDYGAITDGPLYCRLSIDTDIGTIMKLLFRVWELEHPKLVISVIGGSKYFNISPGIAENLLRSIRELLQRSHVWLLTTGYDFGLSKLVGDMINHIKMAQSNSKVRAIGFAKWGTSKLQDESVDNVDTSKKSSRNSTTDNIQDDDTLPNVTQCCLNPYHSHILMADDGTRGNFDTKDFRTRVCSEIIQRTDRPFPCVTMVVNGGLGTIENIYYDLQANIPVILINGTGRIANLLSTFLYETKEFDNQSKYESVIPFGIHEYKKSEKKQSRKQNAKSYASAPTTSTNRAQFDGEFVVDASKTKLDILYGLRKEKIRTSLLTLENESRSNSNTFDGSVFSDINQNKIDEAVRHVMYCLQPGVRRNIIVFNMDDGDALPEVIFKAICQSYDKDSTGKADKAGSVKESLLSLAMEWNCVDIAREFVLENSLNEINAKTNFIKALNENLPAFAYEFLRLDINLFNVFFPDDSYFHSQDRYRNFLALYKNHKNSQDNENIEESMDGTNVNDNESDIGALSYFIKSELDGTCITTVEELNRILRRLIGDYMHRIYFNSAEDENMSRIKYGLKKKQRENDPQDREQTMTATFVNDIEMAQECILRDLYLWSILFSRVELAKVFLSEMKYRTCPALFATKIFNEYHKVVEHDDKKVAYEEYAKYFQDYAINCLDKCDDHSADLTCQTVLQENELYGYVTCLQVASAAKAKRFIASPAPVQAMHYIWYDKFVPRRSTVFHQLSMLIALLTFGLINVPLIKLREYTNSTSAERIEKQVESYAINYWNNYGYKYRRFSTDTSTLIRYLYQIKNFHSALPVKYCYHFASYMFFLLLFSYVLLFKFSPPTASTPSIDWTEILTILLVSFMVVEEVRYFYSQDHLTFVGKVVNYFRDFFKPMTVAGLVFFYLGLILRFTYASNSRDFTVARVIMALDIEIWWLLCLRFVTVNRYLGPYLIAIGKMLKDLLFFLIIIAVVMIGYGVASRSMVYYPVENGFTTENNGSIDISFSGRPIFRQIAYPVYYLLFGEFGNELSNLDKNPDAGWSISNHVLLAVHMMFVNVLLFNLLIAMFSKRFDEIYDDALHIWRYQQYIYTREYFMRSPFIPPVNFMFDVYYLLRLASFYVYSKLFKSPRPRRALIFKMISTNDELKKKWYNFEGRSTYEYAQSEAMSAINSLEYSSNKSDSDSSTKVNEIQSDIDEDQDILAKIEQLTSFAKENLTN